MFCNRNLVNARRQNHLHRNRFCTFYQSYFPFCSVSQGKRSYFEWGEGSLTLHTGVKFSIHTPAHNYSQRLNSSKKHLGKLFLSNQIFTSCCALLLKEGMTSETIFIPSTALELPHTPSRFRKNGGGFIVFCTVPATKDI